VKEYYLSPVIEKNARKGYKPPDKSLILASIIYYLDLKTSKRGIFIRKPVEKIRRIVLLYYPIDILCINDKCMATDPLREKFVEDHMIIGALAFLILYPSTTPYLDQYIVLDAAEPIEYSLEDYKEEYSVPRPKTGPGRYYVPFIVCLYEGPHGRRLSVEPPLYYLADFPRKYHGVRTFNGLRRLLSDKQIDIEALEEETENKEWILERDIIRNSLEIGLWKLKDKKVIKDTEAKTIIKRYL
jgi:hypothetical protein